MCTDDFVIAEQVLIDQLARWEREKWCRYLGCHKACDSQDDGIVGMHTKAGGHRLSQSLEGLSSLSEDWTFCDAIRAAIR